MKILPETVELFHVDGQTDMTKPIVVFRNLRTHLKGVRESILNAVHFINFLQINL
jgi:hypothetical protein